MARREGRISNWGICGFPGPKIGWAPSGQGTHVLGELRPGSLAQLGSRREAALAGAADLTTADLRMGTMAEADPGAA